jgi:hypothetical protein
MRNLVLNYASFKLCEVFRNAPSHKMQLHCILNVPETVDNVQHDSDVMNQSQTFNRELPGNIHIFNEVEIISTHYLS